MTKAPYSNITVYAPLQSSYGFLPASKWPDFMPSLIWTATTDRGSRVVTWEGARLDRDVSQPVSFQAEFHQNGDIEYRYNPAQTNFTGIADGATPAYLASILAADAMSANLILAFGSAAVPGNTPAQGQIRDAPPSSKGVLTVDGVPLLVTDGTVLNLSLPEDRTVDFKFLSRSRLGLAVSVTGNGTPILADDEEGFFGGMARTEASGSLLAATEFRIESTDDTIAGVCVHEIPGTRSYRVILGDAEWERWRKFAVVTGENAQFPEANKLCHSIRVWRSRFPVHITRVLVHA